MKLVLSAGLICLLGLSSPDLDLEVPSGTPLDWDKELHQPTPVISTGTPGRAAPKAVPGKSESGDRTRIQAPTPTPAPAPTVGFSIPNLYNFFRITTQDIMAHIQPNPGVKNPVPWEPPGGDKPEPPVIETGTPTANRPNAKPEPAPDITMKHGVAGAYPPRIPGELAWMCIATALRLQLHPDVVNKAEAVAYLLEVGEVAVLNGGADILKGQVSDVPAAVPPIPTLRDPIDKMLVKMIVLDICSGYPFAMDPTYAKKTLMLGDLSFNSIVECAKSQHSFLKHNAVAILANFQGQKASEELLKIFENPGDSCTKVRAAAGLARKRYVKALPALMNSLGGSTEGITAMVVYALGQIAASADEKDKVKAARKLAGALTNTPDLQWSVLASIARIGAKDKQVVDACVGLKGAMKNKAPGTTSGTKGKILYQCALLAAAASGDAESITEACGLGHAGFHKSLHILAAEVFPNLGAQGITIAQGLATHEDSNVAVAAVRALGRFGDQVDWLKGIAASGKPMVRAAALCSLYGLNEAAVEEACKAILAAYTASGDGAEAFLASLAIQMLDRMNKNDGAVILGIVQKAKSANAVAKRHATNEYDVTKAKIDVFPPLLEVATLALGKTQHEPALPTIVSLLEPGSPVRGEAALALASYGAPGTIVPAAEALLRALVEPSDGYVRFCAYLSLKHLSQKDYYADYIFGKVGDIWPNALKYRDWIAGLKK